MANIDVALQTVDGVGTHVDISPSNPLSTIEGTDATSPVTALPAGATGVRGLLRGILERLVSGIGLPTGAAKDSTLTDGTQRIGGTVFVSSGQAQPLTDTQLRATAVPVSNASLPLPTGAATETTLASNVTAIGMDATSPVTALPAGATGMRGIMRALFEKVTSGVQIGTVSGLAYATVKLTPTVSRYQRLRTTDEPATVLYDSFDGAIDTNQWTTTATGAGTSVSQGAGGIAVISGTVSGNIARIQSVPTFIGSVPGFLEVGLAQSFLANPPTGIARFWGVGTPLNAGPTAANPVQDGYGWLLDTDSKLYAVIYSNGATIYKQDLSAIQPNDGLYRRYNMQIRTDLIVWYLNSQDVPVAESSFSVGVPNVQHLPVLLQAVVGAGASGSSSLTNTGIAVGDTGRNYTGLRDATYPWRQSKVDAGGALKIRDDYQSAQILPDQTGAAGVLTFTFASPVDFIWVTDTSATTTNICRVDPFGGTPSASLGIPVFNAAPSPISVTPASATVKVYAPTGANVVMYGYRRS